MGARSTQRSDAGVAEQPRRRPAVLAGVTGGVVGATCCVGPAIGIATGAGAGSFLLAMGRYRPLLFLIGGLVAAGIVAVMLARRRPSCRTPQEFTLLRSAWTTATLVAFALTYGVGRSSSRP